MDFPLDIMQTETGDGRSPLRFDPPTTTMLLAPWPGEDAMSMDAILQAIANCTGQELNVRVAEPEEGGADWACQVEIEGLPAPCAIWCDRSEDLSLAAQEITGVECGTLVAFETMLSTDDPLTNYINLVRLVSMCMPDTPVLHDTGSGYWLEQDRIQQDFLDMDREPPEDILWRIEVEDGTVRTAGLRRCGRVELAMHDIPEPMRQTAIETISDIAALALELELPGPDGLLEISPGIRVRFEPADGDDAPATIHDEGGGSHPATALQAMCSGDVAVFRTTRRSRQTTRLAQATWGQFVGACRDGIDDNTVDFLVQVPFEQVDAEEPLREHLWLQVIGVDDDTVEARLVHQPRLVTGIDVGWTTTVAADEVSNWMVDTEDGPIGPGDIDPEADAS